MRVLYIIEKMAISRMNRFKRGKIFNEFTVTNFLPKVMNKCISSNYAVTMA